MTYLKRFTVINPLIIGYTTDEHLLLDLDNTTHKKVRYITQLLMQNYPFLGHALIMVSSQGNRYHRIDIKRTGLTKHSFGRDSYHIIFNNIVPYNKCCDIIEVLVRLHVLPLDYLDIRQFRGDMTLRVSGKSLVNKTIDSPVMLEHIPNPYTDKDDGKIREYLSLWLSVRLLTLLSEDPKGISNNTTQDNNNST